MKEPAISPAEARANAEPSEKSQSYYLFYLLIKWAACLTLVSRGWLWLRWDSPIRAILWNEDWMNGPVEELLEIPWSSYAASSDPYIALLSKLLGLTLIAGGALCPWVSANKRRCLDLILLCTPILVLHHLCSWLDKDYQLGMILELTLQSSMPIAVWAVVTGRLKHALPILLTLAASITFIGHGLYAIGYHPVPAAFIVMGMDILSLEESTSRAFLKVAGWLDFVVALLIFIPFYRLRQIGLIYMFGWGLLTALARIIANYSPALRYNGIDPWLAETLVRTSHWLIPLALFLHLKQGAQTSSSK